jgi:hypothetical protein
MSQLEAAVPIRKCIYRVSLRQVRLRAIVDEHATVKSLRELAPPRRRHAPRGAFTAVGVMDIAKAFLMHVTPSSTKGLFHAFAGLETWRLLEDALPADTLVTVVCHDNMPDDLLRTFVEVDLLVAPLIFAPKRQDIKALAANSSLEGLQPSLQHFFVRRANERSFRPVLGRLVGRTQMRRDRPS